MVGWKVKLKEKVKINEFIIISEELKFENIYLLFAGSFEFIILFGYFRLIYKYVFCFFRCNFFIVFYDYILTLMKFVGK